MMSFNVVVLAGNAGRDPETKTIEGTTLSNFPLAVDTYKGRDASGKAKEETMWLRVNAWGKLAETVGLNVRMGHSYDRVYNPCLARCSGWVIMLQEL